MSGPNLWGSGHVWSLWEMLELTADRFSRALMNFARMRALLSDLSTMLPADNNALDAAAAQNVLAIFEDLETELAPIGATFTARALQDFREMVEGGQTSAPILSMRAAELERRLHHEFEAITLLVVDQQDAALYRNAASFLDQVTQQAFPTAIFDSEEAAKCLAVGRHTAAVFHIMRAAEAVVIALAGLLPSVTVIDKNGETLAWGPLTANIGEAIKAMPKGADKDEWHQAHMFLVGCNRAFRTKTAHPVETYTEPQAREALTFTRSFIQSAVKLAQP